MTTESSTGQDLVQIGLGEESHFKLEQLCADRHFSEMRHGYKFAVAYALAKDARPERMESARKNVFSISTVDPDGTLKLAIETLYPLNGETAYRVAERLADWGVAEVDRLIREEFQDVGQMLPNT